MCQKNENQKKDNIEKKCFFYFTAIKIEKKIFVNFQIVNLRNLDRGKYNY